MARIIPAPRLRVPRPAVREPVRGPFAADQTFQLGDTVLSFDTTAAGRAANLPPIASVPPGTEFEAAIATGNNAVTITPAAGDTVGGGANFAVSALMRSGRVQAPPNGANWLVIATGT